jgi:hypothetical protein
MLSVINTRDAGKRYLLATKYKFECSSDINPDELKIAGIKYAINKAGTTL